MDWHVLFGDDQTVVVRATAGNTKLTATVANADGPRVVKLVVDNPKALLLRQINLTSIIAAATREAPRAALDIMQLPEPRTAEERYAIAAYEYADLVRQGIRDPLSVLAKRWNRSNAVARAWIWRAREMGLLSGGGRGRPSGVITEKCRDVLRRLQERNGGTDWADSPDGAPPG